MSKNIIRVKHETSDEYKALIKRIPIELGDKKFFTLKEIDDLFNKYNFKWTKIEPNEWFSEKDNVKSDDINCLKITGGYYSKAYSFYVYKAEGSNKPGCENGIVVVANDTGYFCGAIYSNTEDKDAKILLKHLRGLLEEGYNESYIKKYEELEKRIPKEYPNKKLFTLKEVDNMFKKYNFKWKQIEPDEWYFIRGESDIIMDPEDLDSCGLTEGYNPPLRDFLIYNRVDSTVCGRDCGFIIIADENGNYKNGFYSQTNGGDARILLDYLRELSKEGTKELYTKEYRKLQKKIPIDLGDKKFFTLKEIDEIFKKYNFKLTRIEPYEWFYKKDDGDLKIDKNEITLYEITNYDSWGEFYVYKEEGSTEIGRDNGITILANFNGFFYYVHYSNTKNKDALILLNYIRILGIT